VIVLGILIWLATLGLALAIVRSLERGQSAFNLGKSDGLLMGRRDMYARMDREIPHGDGRERAVTLRLFNASGSYGAPAASFDDIPKPPILAAFDWSKVGREALRIHDELMLSAVAMPKAGGS